MNDDLYISRLNGMIYQERNRMNECQRKADEYTNQVNATIRSIQSLEDARDMYIQMNKEKDGAPDE